GSALGGTRFGREEQRTGGCPAEAPGRFRAKAGGEAGVRTLGTTFRSYNGLANRRLQPLGHLTADLQIYRKWAISPPRSPGDERRLPAFNRRLLTLSATTRVLCVVGLLTLRGTPDWAHSGHMHRIAIERGQVFGQVASCPPTSNYVPFGTESGLVPDAR